MKRTTHGWLQKAEGDYNVARREMRVRVGPFFEVVCIHAEQSAERYLKARLDVDGVDLRKAQGLKKLLDLIVAREPFWAPLRKYVSPLTHCAAHLDDPVVLVTRAQAREAIRCCDRFRDQVRVSLGLAGVSKWGRGRHRALLKAAGPGSQTARRRKR